MATPDETQDPKETTEPKRGLASVDDPMDDPQTRPAVDHDRLGLADRSIPEDT